MYIIKGGGCVFHDVCKYLHCARYLGRVSCTVMVHENLAKDQGYEHEGRDDQLESNGGPTPHFQHRGQSDQGLGMYPPARTEGVDRVRMTGRSHSHEAATLTMYRESYVGLHTLAGRSLVGFCKLLNSLILNPVRAGY